MYAQSQFHAICEYLGIDPKNDLGMSDEIISACAYSDATDPAIAEIIDIIADAYDAVESLAGANSQVTVKLATGGEQLIFPLPHILTLEDGAVMVSMKDYTAEVK